MSRRGLLVGALLGVTCLAAAQVPSGAPVFSTDLEMVHVTATVLDDKGRLIDDLAEEDFTVLENGRPQKIQIFGRAAQKGEHQSLSLDLGMLLDTSQSMLQELKLSQEAAVRFLESIPRARELYTIFFDQDIRISRYDSENQQGLFERIHSAKGGGNTALYDAIAVYLSRIEEAPGRKVLVLLSDGEDSISDVTLGELLRIVRGSPVTIYPIAFTGGFPTGSSRAIKSRAVLNDLAAVTGGQVFNPHASRELAGIYRKILAELSAQYVLGFVSDEQARDDKFRKLKVEIRRDGVRVRHRQGYYPKKPADAS
jgi:Ca-activated chloride channel family protein